MAVTFRTLLPLIFSAKVHSAAKQSADSCWTFPRFFELSEKPIDFGLHSNSSSKRPDPPFRRFRYTNYDELIGVAATQCSRALQGGTFTSDTRLRNRILFAFQRIRPIMKTSNVSPKIFYLRQASQMLPLVQSIVEDIVELAGEVAQTRLRLRELGKVRITQRESEEIYHDEIVSIETVVKEQTERLSSYQQELKDLGINVERVLDGYVDFPSRRLNEPIYLSWKLGESDIRFWRHPDQTCENRQPIDLEIIRHSSDHAIL